MRDFIITVQIYDLRWAGCEYSSALFAVPAMLSG